METQSTLEPVVITVQNHTASGTFTEIELERMVWALRYQALYHYNRSPWVEKGYAAPISDVKLVAKGHRPPAGSYHIELLGTSDDPDAIGYHEGQAFKRHTPEGKPEKASTRSSRGLAEHTLQPLSKIFCTTAAEDGVAASEVASHEMLEMIVDPFVTTEGELRKYLDPEAKQFYIGEVCDAVQEEGYDVGEPEGRPCNVPEAIMSNFVNPGWFGAEQTRPELDFRGTRQAPFELAPGGYMSVEPEDAPEQWTQIFGSKHT